MNGSKLTLTLFLGVNLVSSVVATDLERGFQNPPPEARPWVYWYFMGNLSAKALRRIWRPSDAGIRGAIFLEVDLDLPRGPFKFMGPEWRQMSGGALPLPNLANHFFVEKRPGNRHGQSLDQPPDR